MQTQYTTGWTRTLASENCALRYAESLIQNIKVGKISVADVVARPICRYALSEAFNIDRSYPETLIEQSLLVIIPQHIKSSLN